MKRGLERKLIAYFLLIVLAALMIGIEFVFEMGRSDLKQELWNNISGAGNVLSANAVDESVFAPLLHLRTKIVVMFGVLTLVVAIVLIMFVRNITMPLQKMVDVAKRINEGDLSQVIDVEADNEIGQLGIAINDLTSNLQEVSAFSHRSSERMLEILNGVKCSDKEGKLLDAEKLDLLEKEIRELKSFSSEFEFLNTDLVKFD